MSTSTIEDTEQASAPRAAASSDWVQTGSFSVDTVIDAYEKGGRDREEKFVEQVEQLQELQQQLAHTTRRHAQLITKMIFAGLRASSFSPIQAYLRQNDIADVDVIIAIPEDEFASPNFDKAFEIVDHTWGENALDDMRLDISFLPLDDDLNKEALIADGFGLWYTPSS